MKIFILGHHCKICDSVEDLVWNVVEENEIAATIKRLAKDIDIIKFGVHLTPALVVENEIKVIGRKPRKEEVVSWIMSNKEKQIDDIEVFDRLPSCVDQESCVCHS
jgi:hypothetical protein